MGAVFTSLYIGSLGACSDHKADNRGRCRRNNQKRVSMLGHSLCDVSAHVSCMLGNELGNPRTTTAARASEHQQQVELMRPSQYCTRVQYTTKPIGKLHW